MSKGCCIEIPIKTQLSTSREDIEIDNGVSHFPSRWELLFLPANEKRKNEWAKSARHGTPSNGEIGGGGKTESKISIGKVEGKNA